MGGCLHVRSSRHPSLGAFCAMILVDTVTATIPSREALKSLTEQSSV